jgi:hypothetical protein
MSDWHTLSIDATRLALATSDQGITQEVAAQRLHEVGPRQCDSPHAGGKCRGI